MAQENNIEKNIEELQKKVDEYLNNWKRERADFVNYKKEELERTLNLVNFSKEKFILNLLPVIDNLYLAQAHLKDDGLGQVIKQFEGFLTKEGIEKIEVIGKQFDPNFMEVVEQVEHAGIDKGLIPAESGMVLEEMQKGYLIGEKVLRPAKVKVVK